MEEILYKIQDITEFIKLVEILFFFRLRYLAACVAVLMQKKELSYLMKYFNFKIPNAHKKMGGMQLHLQSSVAFVSQYGYLYRQSLELSQRFTRNLSLFTRSRVLDNSHLIHEGRIGSQGLGIRHCQETFPS